VAATRWVAVEPGIGVLGDFQVLREGQWQRAGTRQLARLGALFAAAPGQSITRERIVEALWADKPPSTAVNTVQVYISQLRSLIGSHLIETTGQGYVLQVQPAQVDAEWFREQVLACMDGSHALSSEQHGQVRESLRQALEVWRGEPYEDLRDGAIAARRSELLELRERAIELFLEVSLAVANNPREIGEVVAAARGQVARQPLRERGHEILIRALVSENDRAQAVQAYRHAVDVFAEQAGVTPSPRLQSVIEPFFTAGI